MKNRYAIDEAVGKWYESAKDADIYNIQKVVCAVLFWISMLNLTQVLSVPS